MTRLRVVVWRGGKWFGQFVASTMGEKGAWIEYWRPLRNIFQRNSFPATAPSSRNDNFRFLAPKEMVKVPVELSAINLYQEALIFGAGWVDQWCRCSGGFQCIAEKYVGVCDCAGNSTILLRYPLTKAIPQIGRENSIRIRNFTVVIDEVGKQGIEIGHEMLLSGNTRRLESVATMIGLNPPIMMSIWSTDFRSFDVLRLRDLNFELFWNLLVFSHGIDSWVLSRVYPTPFLSIDKIVVFNGLDLIFVATCNVPSLKITQRIFLFPILLYSCRIWVFDHRRSASSGSWIGHSKVRFDQHNAQSWVIGSRAAYLFQLMQSP